MSKAIIHIGTHKTATTFIQDTFAKNRNVFAMNDIIYPKIGEAGGHHTLASEWINMQKQFQTNAGHDKIWKYLIDAYADSDKTLFLTTEEFSRAKPNCVNMAQLRDRLSAFDEVEIICTLKAQHRFIQSIYLEISKKRIVRPLINILEEAHKTHLVDGLFMNYNKLYEHLRTGFAKNEITFVPFEKVIKQENGILGEFLNIIGYTQGIETIEQETKPINVSADPLTIWIANTIVTKKPINKNVIGVIQGTLNNHFDIPKKTSLFTQREVDKLAVTFNPLNKDFSAKIADKQPNFELPLITYDSSILHRGNINAGFWRRLIREHYKRDLIKLAE